MAYDILDSMRAMVDYKGFVSRFAKDDRRFFFILIAVMVFVIAVLVIVDKYADVRWYFRYAEVFVNGQIPYEVYDNVAYPPMFLYISAIPALITNSETLYAILYMAISMAFILVAAHYSLKMCDEYGVSHLYVYITFLLLMACVPVHVVDRNDGMATVLAMLGMFMFMKKRESLCFILLAVSVMIKIYPGLIVVAFLLPFIIKGDWKKGIGYALLVAAICILIQLPCYIASPESSFNYITQNSGRPLQIEACASVLVMIYGAIFPDKIWIEQTDDPTVYTYGSDNFRGVFPDALADLMMPLMIIAIAAAVIYFLYRQRGSRLDHDRMLLSAALMGYILVLIFLLFNKVYSAQYGLWPIMLFTPVLILLQHYGYDTEKLTVRYIIFGFTTLLATIFYNSYGGPLFFLATLFKTIALIILLIQCLRMFYIISDKKSVIGSPDL